MRYSIEIKKFLYSHYFYGGVRIACGVSLPAALLLTIFHDRTLSLTIAAGALGVCAVDKPGPLKHKYNEMLACSLIGFIAAFLAGIAVGHPLTLWLTVVPLTFALSMLVVYGARWEQISFATLFMMVVTLGRDHFTVAEALINASWMLAGGLWYTHWSASVSHWQTERLEQQAIAENIFATAAYLRARADFYEPDNDLNECYRQLIAKQIAVVDTQDAARDIVLRNLPVLRAGHDMRRAMLFNLFINMVDLHEMIVAAHTDYALMRAVFGRSDALIFLRQLIIKAARDLENIGLAVLQNRASQQRITFKAELRALEFEIDLMRRKTGTMRNPEAYAMLVAIFRRAWSMSRLIDKMHRHTRADYRQPQTELRIDGALQNFLQHRPILLQHIFSNLTMNSPSFRHALRVTGAVALGLWVSRLLPLTNAYWICLTIVVILKPGFSLTKQRNTQRLIGTAIGCAASLALILAVKSPLILLPVMFICIVMSYSLLLFNYAASVVFTSSYVLILYYLLAPENMRLIGERALDTAIGCAIAIAVSRLFPYWEYRMMKPRVVAMIASMRQYLDAVCAIGQQGLAPSALGNNFNYRLARKNMHIAFANLGNAFSRMMLEPKPQQKFIAELNDLLIQSHTLAAQITAAAPLVAAANAAYHHTLFAALNVVRDTLMRAETGIDGADNECAQTVKTFMRELDAMVANAQKASAEAAETVQELKLLVYSLKQMLPAAQLICKEASAIRLPAA